MKQRLILRRVLLQRLFRLIPTTYRPFTHNTTLTSRSRPQLPFLAIPVGNKSTVRYFTTEKKKWLKHELKLAARYTLSIWGAVACVVGIAFFVNQERLDREFPSPSEWSYLTRLSFRGAKAAEKGSETDFALWVEVRGTCLTLLQRLEDAGIDGAGLQELLDGPLSIEGLGRVGIDITEKGENWRRGYYEVMMMLARAAEHLDGYVVDRTRNIVFPVSVVLGPSNPYPKPISPGSKRAPREENCEPVCEPAENLYLRILTTKGFTNRQKMDAALACATFMDFKEAQDAAERMYEWALSLAAQDLPPSQIITNQGAYTLDDKADPPSENVLNALTALASHKARFGDVSAALPTFLSVLKTRRSLPDTPPSNRVYESPRDKHPWFFERIWNIAQPPAYPPPPDDGSSTPWRDPRELCEEAALNMYIGEILYSTKNAQANREEGLAWTRDAVDLAEEQLRKLGGSTRDKKAKDTCKQCLTTGLENWTTMVERLAKEEEAKKQAGGAISSKFGFWRETKADDTRWAAEEKVVKERIRRTKELVEDIEPPGSTLSSLLKV